MTYIAFLHLISTLILMGISWYQQFIAFPVLAKLAGQKDALPWRTLFKNTTLLLLPFMLAELITGMVFLARHNGETLWLMLFALIILNWLVWLLLQLPLYVKLSRGQDAAYFEKLRIRHWLLWAGWTARGVLLGWLFVKFLF